MSVTVSNLLATAPQLINSSKSFLVALMEICFGLFAVGFGGSGMVLFMVEALAYDSQGMTVFAIACGTFVIGMLVTAGCIADLLIDRVIETWRGTSY